ncbi:alanyl-tRNA synthetase [Candidatus Nanosynbacter lyticus]|uniref:alanine--tRNA ligase n=1 Tax=Candidatus Nanosynbacter lyticus TaxID=2093824 RepID=A0A6S4GQV4_9BACT|nr:alanine--tRNA ligase [Candidatus Nanosynbacter lyticus]AJA06576.1 alanyl-tRNA synthetase [Candidatus Nanosynbacter lyticus]QCT41685.1 alanine--tRNA ligase [TM7 phylum sp. oral taxon 952]
MKAQDIRQKYLDFYQRNGHAVIKRAPLILTNDPTTLFTGAGMQPMIPYLLGEPHSEGKRIADSQSCLRAQDIDDIGDNRHTTFFEMLGNWSLGDYFKKEQINWMWQFLSEEVGLDMNRVYVTCYIGDERYNIPKDTEAAEIWAELYEKAGLSSSQADIGSEQAGYARGIKPGERIFYYDGSKNWWSRNGGPETTPIGDPCGPDSEMFYEFDFIEHDPKFGEHCHPNCDCGRFMEIGNNVFMAYKKVADGVFESLEKPNIDHGSGLERIAAASNNDPDVFKISLLWPIIEKLQDLSGKNYDSHTESMRVIADHLRAATFMAVDGCVPSNKEQGYVMRRLLRRAIRYSFDLGIEQNFMQEVVPVIANLYEADFPEVKESREQIIAVLVKEEKAFRQTLRKGLRQMQHYIDDGLTGEELFTLYDTFGFPVELSTEEAHKQGIKLSDNWRAEFNAKMAEQRQRSKTARKGQFSGGLEGHDPIHLKYHTATHLLGAALRKVLNAPDLQQHGSNITADRLRFDFNHDKLTLEEKQAVEDQVNAWIDADLPVKFAVYPTEEALKMGAIGAFGERYGEEVKVYSIGEDDNIISFEVCGGPHVDHTGILNEDGKRFKITKEESSAAGIRRIKAVLR